LNDVPASVVDGACCLAQFLAPVQLPGRGALVTTLKKAISQAGRDIGNIIGKKCMCSRPSSSASAAAQQQQAEARVAAAAAAADRKTADQTVLGSFDCECCQWPSCKS